MFVCLCACTHLSAHKYVYNLQYLGGILFVFPITNAFVTIGITHKPPRFYSPKQNNFNIGKKPAYFGVTTMSIC